MCKARPRKIEAFLENKWAGVQVEITEDVIFDWKAVLIIFFFFFFLQIQLRPFFLFLMPPFLPLSCLSQYCGR